MKKRNAAVIAAVGALLACGAQAQSSVQLMGTVDAFAGSLRYAGDPGHRSVVDSGGMTTSWFGFKGTEDLGAGVTASFALTSFFQADSGVQGRFANDPQWSRDASVSLGKEGLGKITLGRSLAPNFLPTVIFNPFGDSFVFSPLVLHNNVPLFNGTGWNATTPSDTGWSNEVIYSSPTIGGFSTNLHYQFGEQANDTGTHNAGLNFLYFNGPFAATGFYEHDEVANPVPAVFAGKVAQKDWMLGASYDLTAVKLYGTYGRATTPAASARTNTWSLGAAAPFGAGKVLAGFAHSGTNAGATRRTTTVGYDYNLSKTTDVYAMVMRDSITSFMSGTSFGVGIRKGF